LCTAGGTSYLVTGGDPGEIGAAASLDGTTRIPVPVNATLVKLCISSSAACNVNIWRSGAAIQNFATGGTVVVTVSHAYTAGQYIEFNVSSGGSTIQIAAYFEA
jgi:hypothetical protein